jgi:uncharacterized protein (UPF0179 family)
MNKVIVTLVGEGQAVKGFRFVAAQPPAICKECKLFLVCMGKLVPGRAYEVVDVKDKQHYCSLYEDKVKVAKVVPSPIEVVIKSQHAIEGVTITFTGIQCEKKGCAIERLCKPEGVKKGEKIKIEKVSESVSDVALCKKKLKKVTALVVESSS